MDEPTDIRRRTVSGLAWTGGSQAIGFALQLASNIVLVTLLPPTDFGLVAMVLVFSGLAELAGGLGLGQALVHRESITDDEVSSVFWTQVSSGTLIGLGFALGAPTLAWFYDEPRLVDVTRLVSISFLLQQLGEVPTQLCRRRLEFKPVAIARLAGEAVSGVASIALAVAGAGVYSLVARVLLLSGVSAVTVWLLSGWRPRLVYEPTAVKSMFAYGRNVVGSWLTKFLVRRSDDLLLGKYVGANGLGLYSRAYALMLLPLTQVTRVLMKVMFPAMSRISDDVRIRQIYQRMIGATALVTFPLTLGLLAVSDDFVLGLFGVEWIDMVPILRMFCIAGLIESIEVTAGLIFMAKGRPDWMFRWQLGVAIITIASFIVGIRWGVLGVAFAFAVRTVALAYPNFAIPGRLIGLSFSDVLGSVRGPFFASLAMIGVVLATQAVLPAALTPLARLAIATGVGGITYASLVHFGRVSAYRDVRGQIRDLMRRR